LLEEEEEVVEIGSSACISALLFLVGLLKKFVVGDDCVGTVIS
jgi:hypothetical protein